MFFPSMGKGGEVLKNIYSLRVAFFLQLQPQPIDWLIINKKFLFCNQKTVD